jgi:hypothetical protein
MKFLKTKSASMMAIKRVWTVLAKVTVKKVVQAMLGMPVQWSIPNG